MGSKLTREQVLDYREMVKDRLSEESISFLYDKFLTAAPSGSMDLLSFARYIDSTGSYKCRQIQKMKDNNKRMSLALRVRYLFFTYDNSKSSTGDMSADADSPDYTSVNDDLYVHLFRGFDLDGNGIITFKEFLLYHLAVIYNTEELFYIVFNTYDQDGDGYLSLQDIRATITISTRYVGDVDINHCAAQRVIEEEANRLFGFLDIRKDGYIQKEDMRRIVQKYPQVLEKMKYLM